MAAETFTHPVAGVGELRFAHLDLYDVFGDPAKGEPNGFVPLDRRRKRAELIEDMNDTATDKGQQLVELQAFRNEPIGMSHFIDYLARPTAIKDVVRFAYAKANDRAEMPALSDADVDAVLWALLAPLGIQKPKPAEQADPMATYGDGGGDPANPQIPPTYSATPSATTEATGTESGTGSPTGH